MSGHRAGEIAAFCKLALFRWQQMVYNKKNVSIERKEARRLRVGILGGTFDPIHRGHLEIARAVRTALELDAILLLPSGDPPHKQIATPREDRLRMTQLAAEAAGFAVSDLEIRRKGTTYTAETLKALHGEQPETEWVHILGADALTRLGGWKKVRDVFRLAEIAVVERPGSSREETAAQIEALRREFKEARLIHVAVEGPEIAATELRRVFAEGRDPGDLVPKPVAEYIRRRGLYLCGMDEAALLDKLQEEITKKRYTHTLGVAETAERLAPRFGVEPARARLAALLHDCAKSETMKRMRKLIEKAGIAVEESELTNEAVLHAPAGAAKAELEYGVRDPEILSAIRWHTLGGAHLTPLEALIYVSDCIEPNRKPYPGIEVSRALAEEDIYAAARSCAMQSVAYVLKKGGSLHPRTLEMLKGEGTPGQDEITQQTEGSPC